MTKRKFIYIDLKKAVEIHDYIIKDQSGLQGIKDIGQLESILTHIKNDEYYPEVFDKVTHLVYSIIKFHVFSDGNKRTALALGTYFLGLNYSSALAEKFLIQMENIVVDIAANKINKHLLKDIIEGIFFEDANKDGLLFKIYKALKKR